MLWFVFKVVRIGEEERDNISCIVFCSAKPGSFIVGADLHSIFSITQPHEYALLIKCLIL